MAIFAEKMKARILLDKIGKTITELPLDGSEGADSSDSYLSYNSYNSSADSTDSTGSSDFPSLSPTFSLTPATIDEFSSSRYEHPVAGISMQIPDDDLPRVSSWFGGASSGTIQPLSDTARKRITDSVIASIKSYLSSASSRRLFTSPLRAGAAWLLFDDTIVTTEEPQLLLPDTQPPIVAIRESSLSGNTLQTLCEFQTDPKELRVSIPATTLPESLKEAVKGIIIYATKQASLLMGDESVEGVRTHVQDGVPLRIWNYNRRAEDLVRADALADESFRVLATFTAEEIATGVTERLIPAEGNLDDWKSFPTLPNGGGGGDQPGGDEPGGENPPGWRPHILLQTEALDLGLPEDEKWIQSVTLRGIFRREPGIVRMTLYGSHHRENWRRIASADGWHIRGVRGVRYRWYRVEIDARMRKGDLLEALTFVFGRCKV